MELTKELIDKLQELSFTKFGPKQYRKSYADGVMIECDYRGNKGFYIGYVMDDCSKWEEPEKVNVMDRDEVKILWSIEHSAGLKKLK